MVVNKKEGWYKLEPAYRGPCAQPEVRELLGASAPTQSFSRVTFA